METPTDPTVPRARELSGALKVRKQTIWTDVQHHLRHAKVGITRRLRERIRVLSEWAPTPEFRTDNPCDRLGSVLGPQHDVVQHLQALAHREVTPAIEAARTSEADPVVALAFEFPVLTAARWSEVRWAEWTELDPRHEPVGLRLDD